MKMMQMNVLNACDVDVAKLLPDTFMYFFKHLRKVLRRLLMFMILLIYSDL